jgi:hypothetical protein
VSPLAPIAVRRSRAYLILGVDPNVVASSPRIAPFIARMPGGWARALTYLRASDMAEARQFMSKYDNLLLPAACRRDLPVEAFAIAAGISPTRLWGVIVEAGRQFESGLGSLTASSRHVEVVEASILAALSPEGIEDRTHQLKHAQFLPLPKGSQVNVQVTASAHAAAGSIAASAAPAPEDTIRRIIEARQRQLAGTPAVPALVESTVEAVPEFPATTREPVTIHVPTAATEYSSYEDDGDD